MTTVEINYFVEKELKMTVNQQKNVLRTFSKLTAEQKIKIIATQIQHFYKLREKFENEKKTLLTYMSLLIAIIEYIKSDDNKLAVRIAELESIEKRKSSKRDRLISNWAIIKELKIDQGLSFRKIAKYFDKCLSIKVAHSTISELWNELER